MVKPLKIFVLDDIELERFKINSIWKRLTKNSDLEIQQLTSPRKLGEALAKEDGSNFLLVISDGDMNHSIGTDDNDLDGMTLEYDTDNYEIDGTLEVLDKWIKADPDNREAFTVLHSSNVSSLDEFDPDRDKFDQYNVNERDQSKLMKISKAHSYAKTFPKLLDYLAKTFQLDIAAKEMQEIIN